jgi:TonB family protein
MYRWAILVAVLMGFAGPVHRAAEAASPLAQVPTAAAKVVAVRQWQAAVIQRLRPYLRWPSDAPPEVKNAVSQVQITIDRQGRILGTKVIGSSGYASFDSAARKAFKRARAFPPPPDEMPGDHLTFTMAVSFTEDQKPGTADQEPVADDLDKHR